MDEITPDIVARLASRIYNQPPTQAIPTSASGSNPTGVSPYHSGPAQAEHAGSSSYTAMPASPPHVSSRVPVSSPKDDAFAHAAPYALAPAVPLAAPYALPGTVPQPAGSPVAALSTLASAPPTGSNVLPIGVPSHFHATPTSYPFSSQAESLSTKPTAPTSVSPFGSSIGPQAPPLPADQLSHWGRSKSGASNTSTSHLVASNSGASTSQGLRAFVTQLRQPFASERSHPGAVGDAQGLTHTFAMPKPIGPTHGHRPLDVPAIRQDFPILHQQVHGRPLIWLDNAATTQKPQAVIDAISNFYQRDNSNIHRAAHTLAARATDAYEQARQKVQRFLNAGSTQEIVFARGTTEAINLVAQTYGKKCLQPGDEIVLSVLEHHANIVPWQMVAKERGAQLRVIPVNDRGEIMLEEYQRILGPRTRLVALTHASNSLGTILPIEEMTLMAKRYGARVLIDGAQTVSHIPIDLQSLGADFFVFSGHKIFGPTGIGALYIREELHDVLPPWQGGGNMIRNVTFEETSYSDAPAKFEAGTPNIADAVGLGAALDYVQRLGLQNVAAYEHELLQYATEKMLRIPGLRLLGTASKKVGVLSFILPNKRTEDVGRLLDQEGIAVRAGHHCSQPSLRRFGVESTVRPSLAFYNTHGEIDRLVEAIKRIQLF